MLTSPASIMEEYVERLGDDTLALEVQTLLRLDKESPPFPAPNVAQYSLGNLRRYDGNCNENITSKLNFALS